MYYEIYVDSLFLVNFVMNLLLLELVNRTLLCTATRRRVIAGAALGAGLYLVPFFVGGPGWLKLLLGFALATAGMIEVTFRVRSLRVFWMAMRRLFLYSFLFGGILLFIIRLLPGVRHYLVTVFGVLGLGTLVFLEVAGLMKRKSREQDICRVVLVGKGARITVNALVDTGNSLVEPISGKPVSILEKSVFEGLWKEGRPGGYRVVPYHSIGKKSGILQGFLIPEIRIEQEGVVKCCKDVYVGVSDGDVTCGEHYKMILNPKLLTQQAEETVSGF